MRERPDKIGDTCDDKGGIFGNAAEEIIPVILLGIVPTLAYPCQKLFPKMEEEGRDTQRKPAFIFSRVGYSAVLVWVLLPHVGETLRLICLSYFYSVGILAIYYTCLYIKASGHACSPAGRWCFWSTGGHVFLHLPMPDWPRGPQFI